jgi:hypothetical protein
VTGRASFPRPDIPSDPPRATSPDLARLAVGGIDAISIFDTLRMRLVGEVPVGPLALAWPSRRSLLGLVSHPPGQAAFARIDPDTARIVAEWPVPDSVSTWRTFGGGIVALTTRPVYEPSRSFVGSRVWVRVFGKNGAPRSVRVGLLASQSRIGM